MAAPTTQSRHENPWETAIRSLSEEDRQGMETNNASKLAILESVLGEVEQKKQLCMQNRWKFKRSNGENVIIRDVFEKIARWVDKFKQIGDAAVQYDPAHAALPWAGVRFLLQLAVNDIQAFGSMAEGLETVTQLITRYALFETVYLKGDEDAAVQDVLRPPLVKLYVAVLRYLSRAKQYYDRSTKGVAECTENESGLDVNTDLPITSAVFKDALEYVQNPYEVLKMLLAEVHNAPITEEVLVLASLHDYHGPEILELFMEHDSEFPITEEMLFYLVVNVRSMPDSQCRVIRKFLARGADSMIPLSLFDAAGENPCLRPEMVDILFSGRKSCQITRQILLEDRDFIRFVDWDVKTLYFLLDRYDLGELSKTALAIAVRYGHIEHINQFLSAGRHFAFDTEVIKAAAKNNSIHLIPYTSSFTEDAFSFMVPSIWKFAVAHGEEQLIAFLIERRAPITEEVVSYAAKYAGAEVMSLLLDHTGPDLITDSVIKVALSNEEYREDLLRFFFDHKTTVNITEDMIFAAATQKSCFSLGASLNLIEERCGGIPILISPSLLNAFQLLEYPNIPSNWTLLSPTYILKETDLLELLKLGNTSYLEDRKEVLPVTSKVIEAAINVNIRIFTKLFNDAQDIPVTENMVQEATKNETCGHAILTILFERENDLQATIEVCEAAAANEKLGFEILRLLSSRSSGISVTESVLLAAAGNTTSGIIIMSFLLSYQPEIHITESVLTAAAGNRGCGRELVDMILEKEPMMHIPIEALVAAAESKVRNGDTLTALLPHCRADDITSKVVQAMVHNPWMLSSVKKHHLQSKILSSIPISEEAMELAAKNEWIKPEFFAFLLNRSPSGIITETVLVAAADNHNVGASLFRVLDNYYGDESLTENVLNTIVHNWKSGIDILRHISPRVDPTIVTANTLELAARHLDAGSVQILLTLNPDLLVTRDVLRSAVGNICEGKQVMELLLDKMPNLPSPIEDIIETAALNWKSGPAILRLLLPRLNDFDITANVIKILVRYCDSEILELAFSRNENLAISDEMLEAALENQVIIRRWTEIV